MYCSIAELSKSSNFLPVGRTGKYWKFNGPTKNLPVRLFNWKCCVEFVPYRKYAFVDRRYIWKDCPSTGGAGKNYKFKWKMTVFYFKNIPVSRTGNGWKYTGPTRNIPVNDRRTGEFAQLCVGQLLRMPRISRLQTDRNCRISFRRQTYPARCQLTPCQAKKYAINF